LSFLSVEEHTFIGRRAHFTRTSYHWHSTTGAGS